MPNVKSTAPMQKKIYAYIAKNPDCVGQQIAMALGLEPKQTGYCLMKLREARFVVGKGVTRAMTYKVTAKKLAI